MIPPRLAWAAVAVLALVSPVLMFPGVFGPSHAWVAALIALVALSGAVGLVQDFGYLPGYVGLLALTSLVGWSIAADQPGTVNHFAGLALGLFTMGTVAVWCRTRERLVLATALFMLFGVVMLSVGSRSTTPVHTSKALFKETTAAVATLNPLPMSGLIERTSVNRNALAATGMMILPIAMAVAITPMTWPGIQVALRTAGLLTALWAGVIVVIMQSRSAWISAVVLLWIWARAAMRSRYWWVLTAVVWVAAPAALILFWGDHPRTVELVSAMEARVDIWKQGLQALRPSPWLGIGFDYFRYSGYSPILVFPDQIVGRPHAHNVFLQTTLDVGIVGLMAYLGIIGYVARRALEVVTSPNRDVWVRRIVAGAALSLLSVHVYGLTDAVALGAKVGIFQWLACGLVLAAWRHR